MARGKKTNPLVVWAVEILAAYMKPVEIREVLSLPRRTTYDLIERAKQKRAREEAAQRAREEQEMENIRKAVAKQSWEEEPRSTAHPLTVRRWHS